MSYEISTYSKIRIDPFKPKKELILLEDIAHALSLICRANGHTKHFYSVGLHSVNCALEAEERKLTQRTQLACLLHDASEAYLCDITRPVKCRLPNYLEIELGMQNMVWEAFGLNYLTGEEQLMVDEIDDAMLFYEFESLKGERLDGMTAKLLRAPDFEFIDFAKVEQKFIALANRLMINL
ncbi:MAG: phosphohydrolase [Oscillospiraceae bacterium]